MGKFSRKLPHNYLRKLKLFEPRQEQSGNGRRKYASDFRSVKAPVEGRWSECCKVEVMRTKVRRRRRAKEVAMGGKCGSKGDKTRGGEAGRKLGNGEMHLLIFLVSHKWRQH